MWPMNKWWAIAGDGTVLDKGHDMKRVWVTAAQKTMGTDQVFTLGRFREDENGRPMNRKAY